KNILKKIYETSPTIYTSKTLAVLFNVSSRTIKNDLENIRLYLKKYNVEINSERGKGYWLSDNQKAKMPDRIRFDYLDEDLIGEFEIIEFLLFRKRYIPIYILADNFFYSESNILKKIDEINKNIDMYNLKIIKEPRKGVKLVGNEKKQRIMYSQILKN